MKGFMYKTARTKGIAPSGTWSSWWYQSLSTGFSVFVYDTYFEKVKESYGSVQSNVLDKTCSSTSISLIEISSLEPHRNKTPWNLCLNCWDVAKTWTLMLSHRPDFARKGTAAVDAMAFARSLALWILTTYRYECGWGLHAMQKWPSS